MERELELYFAPTPNGWKVTVMLEECGLPYRVVPVDLAAGAQYQADFLALNPNAKMPVLVDADVDGAPLTVFESGAILQYLAEKTGRFLPGEARARFEVMQWLFWQMANLGPMAGQANHFAAYAQNAGDYARQRYCKEYERLLAVMNYRLRDRLYLAGEYSIADMACYPWLLVRRRLGMDLIDFPDLQRWYETLKQRPALRRGMDVGKDWGTLQAMSSEARSNLFGQGAERYSAD